MKKPTRRQHTVWRKYLRAWAKGDQIWCAMAHDTFEADLMKVGQERDFYRIREMTESDVAWVKASLVDPMRPPELRHAAGQWLAVFATIGGLRRKLEMIGADTSHMEAIYIDA